MIDINTLLATAQKAAIEAGQKILEIYEDDIDVEFKKDDSPLTLADQVANDVIMSFLRPLHIPIISEENKQIPYQERKDWKTFWLVDPLDGTKEFIKRNGEFTVNIALINNGIPIIGVIYVPVKKELFFGSEQGAFKISHINRYQDIELAEQVRLNGKKQTTDVVVVASRSHLTQETENFIDELANSANVAHVKTISAGSSLKICMVAEGKADVYPRYAPTMEWDVAAGHGICKAADIKVLKAGSNEELQYNKEHLMNPWFVVGSEAFLHSSYIKSKSFA